MWLTHVFSAEYTEELLNIHEDEIRRLKEERRTKAPLLSSIKKYFMICDEEKELQAAASDQTRLLGRGRDPGRLLREEKMRKRVQKEKPRVRTHSYRPHNSPNRSLIARTRPSGFNPYLGARNRQTLPRKRGDGPPSHHGGRLSQGTREPQTQNPLRLCPQPGNHPQRILIISSRRKLRTRPRETQ